MARLASDAVGGFFACPPEAVALVLERLAPPAGQPFHLLDPCCGEGAAIGQLAEGLNCPPENVYAVELEEGRSNTCRENLPGANVLAPASYFGTDIRGGSFGLIWCNPPFTEQLGGGRAETSFLARSLQLLAPRGVIALVCPEPVAERPEIRDLLLSWTDELCQFPFPQEVRKYREVITIGRILDKPRDRSKLRWMFECKLRPGHVYDLPASRGPGVRFTKTALTETELLAALDRSPLRKKLEPPEERPLPSPPLAPGAGHLALLLASGHLDGLVHPPGEPPHIVRGTAVKVREVTDTEVDESKSETKTKTTETERIVLTLRVATAEAEILTLS